MYDITAVPTRTLVLGMVRQDGTLPADELYRVAAHLGMSDQQVRLCLRRLVGEGILCGAGRGRHATFQALSPLESLLPGLGFIHFAYQQDAGHAPWDATWHLVALRIPESRRAQRDRFRDQLAWLGGAKLGSGLYVSANDWDDLVEDTARSLGTTDDITIAQASGLRHKGLTDPRDLARYLWPLEELANRYRQFMAWMDERSRVRAAPATVAGTDAGTGTGIGAAGADADLPGSPISQAIAGAVAFVRVIERDPLLPAELLPADFPGRAARAQFVEQCAAALAADPGPNAPLVFATMDAILRSAKGTAQPTRPAGIPHPQPVGAVRTATAPRSPELDEDRLR